MQDLVQENGHVDKKKKTTSVPGIQFNCLYEVFKIKLQKDQIFSNAKYRYQETFWTSFLAKPFHKAYFLIFKILPQREFLILEKTSVLRAKSTGH